MIDEATRGHLRRVDLVGSAAFGAWQPGVSDVDTVIMTSRPATEDDLGQLAKIHAELPRSPRLDDVYLEPEMTRSWPTDRRVVPFVVAGEIRADRPSGELTPVPLLSMQRHGIPGRHRPGVLARVVDVCDGLHSQLALSRAASTGRRVR